MFKGITKKEDGVYFIYNNKEIKCPKDQQTVELKVKECAKKTVKLFDNIINKKMNTQDLIDFNMDEDIDWKFIKLAIDISNRLRTDNVNK